MEKLKYTTDIVKSFQVAQVHREHTSPVSCLDFSQDGNILVSSSSDNTIHVYDAVSSHLTCRIPVPTYGAGIIRFIQDHDPSTILTASTMGDHQIRALDIERRNYIRYFNGHDSQVISLSSSPVGPQFLSSSQDSYIRMWDCRKKIAIGKVRALGTPLVSFDPKGLIFGIAYNCTSSLCSKVKLYDTRNFYDGPFLEFNLQNPLDSVPTCFKFSSDGELFLVVNADSHAAVSVYDAYQGFEKKRLVGHLNASGMSLEASFSPDSKLVASGSEDGGVLVWDVTDGSAVMVNAESHAMPCSCAVWNPVYAELATACQNVQLWLPDVGEGGVNGVTDNAGMNGVAMGGGNVSGNAML